VIRPLILFCLLLCLCLGGPAHAQSPAANGFDMDALANVQTEAIDFMLPRTLEVVTAAQLAMWGLGGLTTIDPALSAVLKDTTITLQVRGRAVREVAVSGLDGPAWAQAAAKIVATAYVASPAMRAAGQAGITKILFDEMLAHLDPYSRYIPPIEAVDDRDRRVGHAGIGVMLAQHGHSVTVRDVVIGSPGALAGLVPGDVIQWVDGRSALNHDARAVNAMLNGPEGTELRMGWLNHDGTSRGATLTRVMIPPETVFPRREGDIEIVQITGFSQTTDQHVIQVIRDLPRGARPVSGIVLDLRGNRGGLVRAAVATANTFLPPGVILRSSGRAPETNRVWLSGGGELAKDVRVVVLVDGGTASAAEILAAALADRGRAVVVGSSTFGKGVVQTIDPLPDGGELFLTWSRILAPRGWPIQSLGVMPQICTSLGEAAVRRQLDALAAGRLDMEAAVAASRAARAPLSPDQIVAIREPCPAADPRESDIAVARSVLESPGFDAALLGLMPEEH
jgi:carboxyl-terminal processing protease